jgi:hypothetical protein
MHALEWLIDGWSVESVAELALKLFYSHGIPSIKFSERLHALTHNWNVKETTSLLTILLVGESVSLVSKFFVSWFLVSRWDVERMSELVMPIVEGLQWESEKMCEFLAETVLLIVNDSIVQRSMLMVVSDEMDNAKSDGSVESVRDRFELLYSVVLGERNRSSVSCGSEVFAIDTKEE